MMQTHDMKTLNDPIRIFIITILVAIFVMPLPSNGKRPTKNKENILYSVDKDVLPKFIEKKNEFASIASEVIFNCETSEINGDEVKKLHKISDWISKNGSGVKLAIEAYPDSSMNKHEGLKLANERAKKIKHFLIEDGTEAESIITLPFVSCRKQNMKCGKAFIQITYDYITSF